MAGESEIPQDQPAESPTVQDIEAGILDDLPEPAQELFAIIAESERLRLEQKASAINTVKARLEDVMPGVFDIVMQMGRGGNDADIQAEATEIIREVLESSVPGALGGLVEPAETLGAVIQVAETEL